MSDPMDSNLLTVMRDDADSARLPDNLSEADVRRMYEGMVTIRAYDERALKLQRAGRIGFAVTAIGEEATQIGTAHALLPEDWIFPSYRQYGVAMYRGATMAGMASHLYGNQDDEARGRQMPAHYTFKDVNYTSISSVIGTQIIHAVGCAMAAQYKGDPIVAATYFGDGATSSNDFHSGLNFAGVYKAPVLFFLVNNQYAISLPVEKQTAASELYIKGEGYGVHSVRVDGNDVIAVYQATKLAADRARRGEGPTLLELLTYRSGSHSSSDDPTRYRSREEMDLWKSRDPIERMKHYMQQLGLWSEEYETRIWEEIRFKINQATNEAEQRPQPRWESIFENVYEGMPPHLQAQCDELIANESHLTLTNHGEFPL
ncbi:MAG: thiamine pyrophosphate-dependent dehydrogenase E1 component subunit alpha [Candidatus Melainabacteria bacterium]